MGGRSQPVVRLLLDHRPHCDAECVERPLHDRELSVQLGRCPLARLVADEHVVAKRLDDGVERRPDVGDPLLGQQRDRRCHDTVRRTDLPSFGGLAGRSSEVAAKEFIRAVEEMNRRHASIQTESPPAVAGGGIRDRVSGGLVGVAATEADPVTVVACARP